MTNPDLQPRQTIGTNFADDGRTIAGQSCRDEWQQIVCEHRQMSRCTIFRRHREQGYVFAAGGDLIMIQRLRFDALDESGPYEAGSWLI